MNVKKGDLAIVTRSYFQENLGAIVSVIGPADPYEDDPAFYWACVGGRPLAFEWEGGNGIGGYDVCVDIADADLRPISGLPDEDTTDTERPIKIEEPA